MASTDRTWDCVILVSYFVFLIVKHARDQAGRKNPYGRRSRNVSRRSAATLLDGHEQWPWELLDGPSSAQQRDERDRRLDVAEMAGGKMNRIHQYLLHGEGMIFEAVRQCLAQVGARRLEAQRWLLGVNGWVRRLGVHRAVHGPLIVVTQH
jgi:hypothetical protein